MWNEYDPDNQDEAGKKPEPDGAGGGENQMNPSRAPEPYLPLDSSQFRVEPLPPAGAGKNKRRGNRRRTIKFIAACLACAILGGLLSTGFYILQGRSGATTLQVGSREAVKLNTATVSTGKVMTQPEIYASYVNSTVGITTEVTSTNVFGQTVQGAASGSGFIISADGYIITNYHVVEDAKTIKVTLYNNTSYAARLVGYDDDSDIAVVKVDAAGLTPVVIGDSDKMNVGDAVMAIGNPLGELTFTFTSGVVSALNRSVTIGGLSYHMIQTDCAINEGNSGGPLFNSYGEVIGIVSAKYASSQIEGLGFAIPTGDVINLVKEIMEKGYVSGKASLGISAMTTSDTMVQQYNMKEGAYVISVEPGGCAEKAGLKQGDIITALGDANVASLEDLISAKKAFKAGQSTTVTVYRAGETVKLNLTFDEEKQTETSASSSSSSDSGSSGNGFGNGGGAWGFQIPGAGGGTYD